MKTLDITDKVKRLCDFVTEKTINNIFGFIFFSTFEKN
jgi:hypothetical protein